MRLLYILFIAILSQQTYAQEYGKLKKLHHLSDLMIEVSGVSVIEGSNLIWMINDSGNTNVLFGYNTNGSIEREIVLDNAENIDWEDLATDASGTLYIGNFGNNKNDRKTLSIYTVSGISTAEDTHLEAQQTEFYFEDQKEFPPKKTERNFDAKAFIKLGDYFYIFTKNRSKDFNGVTKVYKVPAKKGDFKAKLIASYSTCNDPEDCFITSATISKDNKTLVLLTYNKLFVITDFKGDDFFNGIIKTIDLEHTSQKEGVTFKEDNTLYITDERRKKTGGNLYEFTLE